MTKSAMEIGGGTINQVLINYQIQKHCNKQTPTNKPDKTT